MTQINWLMDYLLQLKNVIYKFIHDSLSLPILQVFFNRLPSMCVVNKENIVSLFFIVFICVEQNWKLSQPR